MCLVALFMVLVSPYLLELQQLSFQFLGTMIGMISGYFGGIVDMIIQRIMDAIMSIPALILALFIAALLGPAIQNVIIALVIIEVPRFARIVRGKC